MSNFVRLFSLLLVGSLFLSSCSNSESNFSSDTAINTAHLDHLFEEILLNGEAVGIIHIYSEYPDYEWIGDDDEGIACVDDVSRAAVFYLRNYSYTGSQASLEKAELLLKFLLAMQAENGYFYNFVWPDHSIHKTGITTKDEPTWWSWRTLWSFAEAVSLLDENNDLVPRIMASRDKLINVMLAERPHHNITDTVEGVPVPTWLPFGYAADQAALILMGLTPVYLESRDTAVEHYIRHIGEGLLMMQVQDSTTFANGAFLSWKNLWHAYGNSQAYALLRAGQALQDTRFIDAALLEVAKFYPAILEINGLNHFYVRNKSANTEAYNEIQFSQIAYNYRPMIWASLQAWELTKEQKYLKIAEDCAQWFTGSNVTSKRMYDAETGRTFDGIINETEINQNSGAESTIEALLALQELNRYIGEDN